MQNCLRVIRKQKGHTLKTLAELTGLSIGTIGNFETGTRRISQDALKSISEALNVSVAEILPGAESGTGSLPIPKCENCICLRSEIAWLKAQVEELIRKIPDAKTR